MKTQLYSLPDWQEALRAIGWEDAPTQKDVDAIITRELTRGAVTFEPQSTDTPIENGCRVTLKTQSVLPKFNREKVTVVVGSRLYDAALEEKLCGMTQGQTLHTQVKGEAVTATVLAAEKKVYPPLSDALVQNLHLEGISTLSAYCGHMEQTVKGNYAAALCQKLLDRLLADAEILPLEEEDILAVIDREYDALNARFSLDAMTEEKWMEAFGSDKLKAFYAQIYPDVARLFGTTRKASYYESRKADAIQTIRTCLVLRHILSEQTEKTDPTLELHARQALLKSMQARLLTMIYGGS